MAGAVALRQGEILRVLFAIQCKRITRRMFFKYRAFRGF